MDIRIRPYQEADYRQVIHCSHSIYPDRMESSLATRLGSRRIQQCFVAALNGTDNLVGYALTMGMDPNYQKIRLEIIIHPQYRGSGFGSMLYQHVMERITEFNPRLIQVRAWEEYPDAVDFFQRRGFLENHRMIHLSLSLTDFDPALHSGWEDRLAARDIHLTTLAEEQVRCPESAALLHELDNSSAPHFPRDEFEPFIPVPLEKSTILQEDSESVLIAKHRERFIGYSHFKETGFTQLAQGSTAVLKDYWNQGIATALKIRILESGKANGYQTIRTTHRSTNTAMRIINEEKLGYAPFSSEIRLEKRF